MKTSYEKIAFSSNTWVKKANKTDKSIKKTAQKKRFCSENAILIKMDISASFYLLFFLVLWFLKETNKKKFIKKSTKMQQKIKKQTKTKKKGAKQLHNPYPW